MISPPNSSVGDSPLEELFVQIAKVEQEISAVEKELDETPADGEKIKYLRDKELLLRKNAEQLRKEKEQLRNKEEQLRERDLILLRSEVQKTHQRPRAVCSGGFSYSSSTCSTTSPSHSPSPSILRTSHFGRCLRELLFTVSTATPKDCRQQRSTRRPSCDTYRGGADAEKQPFIHYKTS
eukprot:NODE_5434_length_654_cov_749.077799_g5271_i0.p1 GENE.NODE_5434_length_654_cov_749.077799_g5271_i0~~NODE_5434_length_654_cov_749.077799_g5271_i0.p1  ORF type:complete len:180 (-),score=6.05 NODE_5434_length_654_cov_749.077799_g5271_i0:40-579(-)